jgi:hypothetical protein
MNSSSAIYTKFYWRYTVIVLQKATVYTQFYECK